MCWNADISLNTFIFGLFSMIFIFITNTYTKYKTHTFNNPLMYLFLGVVISMQLLEFFAWRNLKNNRINTLVSKIISIIVTAQPLLLMLLIENTNVRYCIIGLYILYTFIYRVYKSNFSPFDFHISVLNGHLKWEHMYLKGWERIHHFIYLAFYIISLLLVNDNILNLFTISSLLISFLFYYNDGTIGSMWCWLANLLFVYFIVNILFIQPFYEYNGIC